MAVKANAQRCLSRPSDVSAAGPERVTRNGQLTRRRRDTLAACVTRVTTPLAEGRGGGTARPVG